MLHLLYISVFVLFVSFAKAQSSISYSADDLLSLIQAEQVIERDLTAQVLSNSCPLAEDMDCKDTFNLHQVTDAILQLRRISITLKDKYEKLEAFLLDEAGLVGTSGTRLGFRSVEPTTLNPDALEG